MTTKTHTFWQNRCIKELSVTCKRAFHRNKQMMGLGSLFGEGDLQQLDGDPVKEKQVVDRQVTALWEIL